MEMLSSVCPGVSKIPNSRDPILKFSAVQMFLYYDRYNLIYGWEKGLC
jgi:hypothetical protein